MNDLINESLFQTQTPIENGVFTKRTLNGNSRANSNIVEEFQNVDVLPFVPYDADVFDPQTLPAFKNKKEVLQALTELMIRFDNSPKGYQKSDYEHLVKIIVNSSLYTYGQLDEKNISTQIFGTAELNTNPFQKQIDLQLEYPGVYLANIAGDYPFFGVTVTNDNLYNSLVLLVPYIDESGIFVNYQVISHRLTFASSPFYRFQPNTPSNKWEITHPLNKRPSVTTTDLDGNEVKGHVKYEGVDKVIITFAKPFDGYAELN